MSRLLLVGALLWAVGCTSFSDVEQGRTFPCTADGGAQQCAAGWRCGLGGQCFNPAVEAGKPLTCTSTELHCSDGWRCGVADPRGARTCQRVGEGQAYPCGDNADCEDGWRCDPVNRQCTSAEDRLLPSSLDGLQVVQVSPLLPDVVPSHVAVGALQYGVPLAYDGGNPGEARGLAFIADGGLTLIVQHEEDKAELRPRLEVTRHPVDEASVAQLAPFGVGVAVRFVDGRVEAFNRDEAAKPLLASGATRLSVLNPGARGSRPVLGVATAGSAELFAVDGTQTSLVLDGGRAVAEVASDATRSNFYLSVETAAGGEVAVVDLRGVRSGAVELPPAHRPLRAAGERFMLVEMTDGARRLWSLMDRAVPRLESGPCPACPFGAEPLQVTAQEWAIDQPPEVVVRCPAEPTGGLDIARTWLVNFGSPSNGCADTRFEALDEAEAPWLRPVRVDGSSLGWRAFGGGAGRFWYQEDSPRGATPSRVPQLHPLVLDRMPDTIVRVALGGGAPQVRALTGRYSVFTTPLGLTVDLNPNEVGSFTILGAVANQPGVVLFSQGMANLNAFPLNGEAPQMLAAVEPGVVVLSAPATGAIVSLSNGRSLAVVSSGDALYGADVTRQLMKPDSGVDGTLLPPARLELMLVPAPGVPIRDVAAGVRDVKPGDEVPLAGFYVLARDAVFSIDVLNDGTWRATPIPLSASLGPPRELWSESETNDAGVSQLRGRVAHESGSITALPTPVVLTSDVPRSGVIDFARLCGDTLAIVDGGVARYVSGVGYVGVPGVTLTPQQSAGARFFEAGNSTFLAAPDGVVWELFWQATDGGFACPPR